MDKFSALALSIFFRILIQTHRYGYSVILFSLSFIIHIMQLYSTLSFIQNISLFLIDQIWIAWNQGKEQGQKGISDGLEGGGGRGEMQQSLETCLWCRHSMISVWCQMSSCWQICGAVDSIVVFQYHAPTIREKILKYGQGQGTSPVSTLSPSQTTSRLALLHYSKDPAIMNNFFGTMALCYSRGSIKILQTSYGWREKKN